MMSHLEMVRLRKRLFEFYTVDEANKWMHSPHPQLDGRVPILSNVREVSVILDRLESGAYL